jgi:hypothetical protein
VTQASHPWARTRRTQSRSLDITRAITEAKRQEGPRCHSVDEWVGELWLFPTTICITCTHAHTCTHTRAHTRTRAHAHTHARTHAHAHAHACTCTHARTRMHAHTCTRTHTQATRAHTHTHARNGMLFASREGLSDTCQGGPKDTVLSEIGQAQRRALNTKHREGSN